MQIHKLYIKINYNMNVVILLENYIHKSATVIITLTYLNLSPQLELKHPKYPKWANKSSKNQRHGYMALVGGSEKPFQTLTIW